MELLLSKHLTNSHSLCEKLQNMHQKQANETPTLQKDAINRRTTETLAMDNN